MPNSNYRAGRAFEYAVKKTLERENYIVLRTAGSHGFADLVAIDPIPLEKVAFIQCKIVKTEAAMKSLVKKFKENPPLRKSPHWQCLLVVKIKGERGVKSHWFYV